MITIKFALLYVLTIKLQISASNHIISFKNTVEQKCQTRIVEVKLNFPGCISKNIRLSGCGGNCKSEAIIDIYSQNTIISCQRCQPIVYKDFFVPLYCSERRNKLEYIKLSAAKKCSCIPCPIKVKKLDLTLR